MVCRTSISEGCQDRGKPCPYYIRFCSEHSSPRFLVEPSHAHDEIRMVLHLRFDLYPIFPADPPSLVDIPITQQTRLCRLAQAIDPKARRSTTRPTDGPLGRYT